VLDGSVRCLCSANILPVVRNCIADDVIQDRVRKVASTGSRMDAYSLWFGLFVESLVASFAD
jgi:hypothetical protein